jgi:Polyketide cyclase / dehydrase and lipid transport
VTTDERWVVSRTIDATPAKIFAILSDPSRHKDTEPGDWVRDAIDTEKIAGTGQIFAMNMFRERIGGPYVMHNLVTVFEQDRAIAWSPGRLDESGNHKPGGWWWRYDLTPNGQGTDVTLTYDWSATPQKFRDEVGTPPPFELQFLEDSLEALSRSVARS